MVLYFITGNKNKFKEAKSILPFIRQLDIDLPEIQSIDAKEIIKAKLLEALRHKKADFIIEDSSLYLDCFKKELPGPLIKWFLKAVGNKGLVNMVEKLGNNKAKAKTIVGYAKNSKEIYFFEGLIKGIIVSPRGKFGFGWDFIFQPEGFSKTFAEMNENEKNSVSMRKIALNKFKKFLEIRK